MSTILAGWAVLSVVGGAILIAVTSGRADAFGWQCLIWGIIDLPFALPGLRASGPMEAVEREKLAGALRFSIRVLNPIWLITGVVLLAFGLWGHGLGVMVQGGFLTAYDPVFLRRLRHAKSRTAE